MSCKLDIQADIWMGYAEAAAVLGDEYRFYRIPGTTKRPKFDTGLEYSQGLKYPQRSFDSLYSQWDTGRLFDQTPDPTRFDKPGERWDGNGTFDPAPPVDPTKFDGNGAFDSGLRWDQPGELVGIRMVALNAEDMKFSKPSKYGKATWYALFDGEGLQVGDYFVGPQGVFFVAGMDPLLPIFAVKCNRTVTIYRPQAQTGIGAVGYGGNTRENQTIIAKGVPCSILQGTKGERAEANLPGDARSPWWQILMPGANWLLAIDDILEDDISRRYVISSPELTDAGWRISAMSAVP